MKKLSLFVFVVILAMGTAFAQPGGGDPAANLQKEIDNLTKELSLSKDQVAKITPIVTEARQKQSDAFAKMRESGNVDRDKMREERMKMSADLDKQLKAVLTPEQGVKLDEYRKKQAEERAKMNHRQ